MLIEDYNNSSAIRLGAEYTIPSDVWKLRAGFVGASSAAPAETVTPLLPEQDRTYWTLGVGIPFMKRWTVDAGYAHVSTPGARGRIVERVSESQTAAQLCRLAPTASRSTRTPSTTAWSGRIDAAGPGVRNFVVHLKPGRYVVFCNMAGHAASGMLTSFRVR